jgi:hypothetical protein
MTDHPDLEALSAHLDGEDAGVAAHLDQCPACREELAALEQVRAAVGAPPPPAPAAARDRAVAIATGRVRRFPPRWAAAGAAAAVAAGVLVVVAVRPGSHGTQTATKSSRAGSDVNTAAGVLNGGDLGDISDDAALRAKVEPALHPQLAAPEAATGRGSAAGGDTGGAAASEGHAPAVSTNSRAAPLSAVSARCESAAKALQPTPQSLIYAASAHWQGTPAEVLAFTSTGPTTTVAGRQAPVRVYVMAARGCRLLVFQSYAP